MQEKVKDGNLVAISAGRFGEIQVGILVVGMFVSTFPVVAQVTSNGGPGK